MSFRNPFVTDFIYQATEECVEANVKVREVFEKWCGSTLSSVLDERGYGYYAGWFKSLSGEYEAAEDLRQIVAELEKVTRSSFRLTVMVECGPVITYQINPLTKQK